jgi:hypothetical protein
MLRRFRWPIVLAGVALGLTAALPQAQAWHKKKCDAVTYYEPACSPCGPQVMVPVTVTTRKCGLFHCRKVTTVTYGAPVPLAAPAPPPQITSGFPPSVAVPAPSPIIVGPY